MSQVHTAEISTAQANGEWDVAESEFQDRPIFCVDCGQEFVWTAGEQQFFADKNFKNEPKRCKNCKGKRATHSPAGIAMPMRRRRGRNSAEGSEGRASNKSGRH